MKKWRVFIVISVMAFIAAYFFIEIQQTETAAQEIMWESLQQPEEKISETELKDETAELKPYIQSEDIAAAYKILNQDLFDNLSGNPFIKYLDSLSEEIYEYADEIKADFEAVPYEGYIFPAGLIALMEEEVYHLKVKGEISASWYETLDTLGADKFRLDLEEMYQLFPELDEYKDEIETEYDAYNRIFKKQSFGSEFYDCEAVFHMNISSGEEYYIFVYTTGGTSRVREIEVVKRTGDEFAEVDRFQAQMGGGRVIQYEDNFYYVTTYANDILYGSDGIRIHKLGTDALNENILIRYLPEHYGWKNIYYNEDVGFQEELEDYIDSIKTEITSDEYLENGLEDGAMVYYGDETEAPNFVVDKGRYYKIDFANIGIPVYMRKHNTFPPRVPWRIMAEFYLYDEEQDEVIELENMEINGYWSAYMALEQIWFKEINQKVLTFRVYYISDYNYLLNVMLIEGDKVTQIRNDIFSPDKSRIVLAEGEIFWTM